MPDLLLELFSEEIPARMQAQAAEDLQKLVLQGLSEQGLSYEGAAHFATPRRLALHVAGVPVRQADAREEKKGPRVGAPEAAVHGFLKSAGLASLSQARIEKDPKKGDFYLAVIEKPGRATVEVLAEMLPGIITSFPWPKSMRWGAQSIEPEALRWVRPLHSILATFGPETEEPETIDFEVGGIKSGHSTYGHRFMAPGEIKIRRFDDYGPKLEKAKVVLDAARRRDIILHDARDLCLAQGLELVEDNALLQEVAGLVEWPVVLMGHFDERFLELPPEVIRTTIRINQKCFVLHSPATGRLANKFILIANIEASDGGASIADGNGRVVQARLTDAQFFWETDLKIKLEDRLPKLETIIFHEKLGTQSERVERLVLLSQDIAALTGADLAETARAALLCKADLVSEMVGEFPELQGFMGRAYAKAQGEPGAVAEAIEDHYKPQGPSDRVPSSPVAVAVALADKIDLLVGFWAVDERPTGSKDPFALRRAALGTIALILENKLRIPLRHVLEASFAHHVRVSEFVPAFTLQTIKENDDFDGAELSRLTKGGLWAWQFGLEPLRSASSALCRYIEARFSGETEPDEADAQHFDTLYASLKPYESMREIWLASASSETVEGRGEFESFRRAFLAERAGLFESILGFFADRLKVFLRERGARFDLIDAVFAVGGQDDLWLIVERVDALNLFIESEEGKNLLAGYRRAANILKAEEKKASTLEVSSFAADFEPELLRVSEEMALARAIDQSASDAALKVKAEDFKGAMRALAELRAPVDAFFGKVTVNAPEPELRLNRLRLLSELRRAVHEVADFSLISG